MGGLCDKDDGGTVRAGLGFWSATAITFGDYGTDSSFPQRTGYYEVGCATGQKRVAADPNSTRRLEVGETLAANVGWQVVGTLLRMLESEVNAKVGMYQLSTQCKRTCLIRLRGQQGAVIYW